VALARSASAAAKIQHISPALEIALGDLNDVDAMTRGMQGCDVVYHCAAIADDWGTREAFFLANVEGTRNVLRAAKAAGVRKFIHVSTEAVLAGGDPIIRADETVPRTTRPIGLYPETKGLAEELVLEAASKGEDVVIVRPRFIWGKGDTTVLPKLVESVQSGAFRWIDGGHYLTSTCHVDNVVEGMFCAAVRGTPGNIYFLTDGEPVECRYFMSELLRSQGVPPPDGNVPSFVVWAAAWVAETWCSIFGGHPFVTRMAVGLMGHEVTVSDAKARREIGYVGRKTMVEGLQEMTQEHNNAEPASATAAPPS
jgi:nucleoside-diphosphate-sugar epimerase